MGPKKNPRPIKLVKQHLAGLMNKPELSLGPAIQTPFYLQSPDHEAMPMVVNPNDSVIKINPKGPGFNIPLRDPMFHYNQSL